MTAARSLAMPKPSAIIWKVPWYFIQSSRSMPIRSCTALAKRYASPAASPMATPKRLVSSMKVFAAPMVALNRPLMVCHAAVSAPTLAMMLAIPPGMESSAPASL